MLGLVNRTLHGDGSLAGAPGTGFTGAMPFPQTNPLLRRPGIQVRAQSPVEVVARQS